MKQCKKCHTEKEISKFYKHPKQKDGYDNTCKDCRKDLNKVSNGKEKRNCVVCTKEFRTTITEINRGGGNCCSRNCWYVHFKKDKVKRETESPNWKGNQVGNGALHNWVQRHLGKPRKCDDCKTTEAKQYDWANISQEYKRELSDWKRLCRSCHAKFDYPTRFPKWKESVIKLGWNVKK